MGTPLSTQTVNINKLYQRSAQELAKGLEEKAKQQKDEASQEGKLVQWGEVDGKPQVKKPNIEDRALLRSTTVSTRPESVSPKSFMDKTIDAAKEKFKNFYTMSKSHNLLIARFAASCGVGVLGSLLATKVSVEAIEALKTDASQEAQKQIAHSQQQTQYDKFMITIT